MVLTYNGPTARLAMTSTTGPATSLATLSLERLQELVDQLRPEPIAD